MDLSNFGKMFEASLANSKYIFIGVQLITNQKRSQNFVKMAYLSFNKHPCWIQHKQNGWTWRRRKKLSLIKFAADNLIISYLQDIKNIDATS